MFLLDIGYELCSNVMEHCKWGILNNECADMFHITKHLNPPLFIGLQHCMCASKLLLTSKIYLTPLSSQYKKCEEADMFFFCTQPMGTYISINYVTDIFSFQVVFIQNRHHINSQTTTSLQHLTSAT